jgi:two-component system sensor histidine kinase TctE
MGPGSGSNPAEAAHRRPSVRRRLLAFLLIPALLLMILDTGFVYFVALKYSNHVHDRDLGESTRGLSNAFSETWSNGQLPPDARQLIEFSQQGRSFYAVYSERRGFISGNAALATKSSTMGGTQPVLFDAVVNGKPVRAAAMTLAVVQGSTDRLTVTVAETLRDRQQQAREILLLTIPVEALLIAVLMVLVWQGVRFGLRILDAPVRRLAMRERNLAPITGPDIPIEILPLTRTIDGLFERVATLVELQERFVADAAHQLRTPLAGLSLHVEQALATTSEQDRRNALQHIQALVTRMTRSANQLLALARAQAPLQSTTQLLPMELARWLPEVVSRRIPEALHAGVDLGYEAACDSAMVAAEAHSLQELIDNLIDNAIAHVAREGTITVGLRVIEAGQVELTVDDDGPGVAAAFLPRLGERFFRAPGAADGGSGLGLAIVARIVEVHHATLIFDRSALGGLQVTIRLPALAAVTSGVLQ